MSDAKPSCMRAPPEAVNATTGSPSSAARRTRRAIFSPTAVPIDPIRKVDSITANAVRMPAIRPAPVRIPSSSPVFSRSAASFSV